MGVKTGTPFICVEGPDGSGKSALVAALKDHFSNYGVTPFVQPFPDRTTKIGGLIGQYLLGSWRAAKTDGTHPQAGEGQIGALVHQALQAANRLERVPDLTAKLQSGVPVFLDRYWPSGYAYGCADGLAPETLIQLNKALPQPGLLLLLDVPVGVAIERQLKRGELPERYEGRADYLEEVADRYRELWWAKQGECVRGPGDSPWQVIDGTQPADLVLEDALGCIRRRWPAAL